MVNVKWCSFFSQEEIESLRAQMSAQTLLVVVGSSDDALRVKRLNRSMEGVSQTMIDSMIMVWNKMKSIFFFFLKLPNCENNFFSVILAKKKIRMKFKSLLQIVY